MITLSFWCCYSDPHRETLEVEHRLNWQHVSERKTDGMTSGEKSLFGFIKNTHCCSMTNVLDLGEKTK